jgi:beta-phosphoglucomutase-like phosphatase (HAD superfamily)
MDLKLENAVQPIDLVVFDCDGVLLDTMPAKIEAFRQWVPAAHRACREAFMREVMAGFGKSRATHIAYFYQELLQTEPDPAFLDAEVARFTALCEPLCAGASWRTGSRAFVEACSAAGVPRYVLSGTPQAPLEAMLASAGGTAAFDVIIGSPPAKPESLQRILAETGTAAHRTVFIGDANADQQAALHVGAHFVYIASEANRPEAPIATEVTSLLDLLP